MSSEGCEVTCSVSIEHLQSSGNVLKKSQHRNITIELGRDEFKEVVLRVIIGDRDHKFKIKDIQIHKKFAKEGKATIKLPEHNVQLMLSNSPPDQLRRFIQTLVAKLEGVKQKGFLSERKKLFSDKSHSYEQISPLNMKDVDTINKKRTQLAERALSKFVTPKGKKRRFEAMGDKENEGQACKVLKLAKKQLVSPGRVMNPLKLSKEQGEVLQSIRTGQSVFFTGSAGTGKSFLMKRIIGALPPQHTSATASTGVAACHIGGTTLHAFAGIGSGRGTIEQCVELASRPAVAQNWRKCRHLVIDEVSMVDGEFLDKLDTCARVVRKNSDPFGGIQVIACGDFLQLPPVTKGKEKKKFAFQSRAWRKGIAVTHELTEVRRQSDKIFVDILQNIRMGRCPERVEAILKSTRHNNIERDGILATRLCTHKDDVNHINEIQMNKLEGESRLYESSDSDPQMAATLNALAPVPQNLNLKIGAQVMLARNQDVQKGLVNGARGVVSGFEPGKLGYPIVKFLCGEELAIKPERWTFKVSGGVYLTRRQLPLKLAWAISIHKSQGMSLDCVEISLSRVFESGQAYVALSRARSLEGLRVLDFDRSCVRADPEVLDFYRHLKNDQDRRATDIGAMW